MAGASIAKVYRIQAMTSPKEPMSQETQTIFEAFPKIKRLTRDCVVTEKIDGTNAQVHIADDGTVTAGSRNRFLTVDDDNFGFAKWVAANAEALRETLGPGRHFGEWWGSGIQRTYGLKEKRLSLFNDKRWGEVDLSAVPGLGVVPVLYRGTFDTLVIEGVLSRLCETGSVAAPGFRNPEGIVVYHTASGQLYKKTLDGDGHKGGE